MNCYKCGSKLDTTKNTCTKCGTDIRIFKKIVYASNRYYNEGLLKAQARDLSGARESLRTSLKLYKKNMNARNLLGLVNYAMGESAEGLKEWVISKNLHDNNNMADRYINNMKRNFRELDSDGHGIKKYNQALEYARTGARDLATIQLKKVVSVHSNMVKAYELLALLYIDDGKYDQARKVLNRCLEVDRGNPSALHYLMELDAMPQSRGARSVGVAGDDDREHLIIPVRFRDYGTYLTNALYIITGILIGAAIAWFVIVPGRVKQEAADVIAQVRDYETQIGGLTEKIAELEAAAENESRAERFENETAENPTEEETEAEGADQETTKAPKDYGETFTRPAMISSWKKNQEAVLTAVNAYNDSDFVQLANVFCSIDPAQITNVYQGHYQNLAIIATDEGVYNRIIESAEESFEKEKFKKAAELYDAAALLHPGHVEAFYQAAVSYEAAEMKEVAANRYWQTAKLFGDSDVASECKEKYKELTGKEKLPKVPDGTDISELNHDFEAGDFISIMTGEPYVPTEPASVEESAQEGEAEAEGASGGESEGVSEEVPSEASEGQENNVPGSEDDNAGAEQSGETAGN